MSITSFAKNTGLANLKFDVDKLDIGKLKNVPTNLNALKSEVDKLEVDKLVPVLVRDLVKNAVVNKDVYNTKIKNIEDKISDITNLPSKTTLSVKINEVKCLILITWLRLVLLLLLKIKYLALVI